MRSGVDASMITIRDRSRSGRLVALAAASAVATSVLTFGVAWAVIPSPTTSVADQADPSAPTETPTPAPGAVAAGFEAVPQAGATGKDLPAPPDDAVITFSSYHVDTPPVLPGQRAPWWRSSVAPRVRAISQFDHGGLAGVNCTMAAGAMLANLAYGIVTTGSQLARSRRTRRAGLGLGTQQRDAQRMACAVRPRSAHPDRTPGVALVGGRRCDPCRLQPDRLPVQPRTPIQGCPLDLSRCIPSGRADRGGVLRHRSSRADVERVPGRLVARRDARAGGHEFRSWTDRDRLGRTPVARTRSGKPPPPSRRIRQRTSRSRGSLPSGLPPLPPRRPIR